MALARPAEYLHAEARGCCYRLRFRGTAALQAAPHARRGTAAGTHARFRRKSGNMIRWKSAPAEMGTMG